jgi:hypothetical protein
MSSRRPSAFRKCLFVALPLLYKNARILTNSANYRLPGVGTLPRAGSAAEAAAAAEQASRADSGEDMCECGHPQSQHDAIATRYCGVTVAGSLTRRCVCPGQVDDR